MTTSNANQNAANTAAIPDSLAMPAGPYANALGFAPDLSAVQDVPTSPMPDHLFMPILEPYDNALSTLPNPAAYLKADPAMSTDTPLFALLYSIALYETMDHAENRDAADADALLRKLSDPGYPDRPFKVGMPDLVKSMGYAKPDKRTARRIVERIKKLQRLTGVLDGIEYPALAYVGYDEAEDALTFHSPYINRTIMAITRASIRCEED